MSRRPMPMKQVPEGFRRIEGLRRQLRFSQVQWSRWLGLTYQWYNCLVCGRKPLPKSTAAYTALAEKIERQVLDLRSEGVKPGTIIEALDVLYCPPSE